MLTDYFNSSEAFPPTAGGENWWAGKRYRNHPTALHTRGRLLLTGPRFVCLFVCLVPAYAPTRVVELGAGTGIPGIFLASKGARVVLTDLPDVRVAQTSPYAHRTTVSLVSQHSTLTMASIHRLTAAATTTTGVAAHEVERRSQRPPAALA